MQTRNRSSGYSCTPPSWNDNTCSKILEHNKVPRQKGRWSLPTSLHEVCKFKNIWMDVFRAGSEPHVIALCLATAKNWNILACKLCPYVPSNAHPHCLPDMFFRKITYRCTYPPLKKYFAKTSLLRFLRFNNKKRTEILSIDLVFFKNTEGAAHLETSTV